MKFKSLKSITTGIIVFLCILAYGCNNESGNTSTGNTESDTANKMTSTSPSTSGDTAKANGTRVKRTGKASVKMNADADSKIEKDKMGYYSNTEVLPAYNGGQTALENYITNNIEYPEQAIDNNAEGTVSVHFLVDEKGNISNVTTVGNKVGYGLEEEAIRVVSKMPQWTPGQVKGKKVKTWRTLPITYRLEG